MSSNSACASVLLFFAFSTLNKLLCYVICYVMLWLNFGVEVINAQRGYTIENGKMRLI